MSAYYLAFGAMFTPTAFMVYLETHNPFISSVIFFVGMISVLIGSREINKEEMRKLNEFKAQIMTQDFLDRKADARHKELIAEIKKLRGDKDDKPTNHFQSVL
jgi:hypothetical protein